MRNSSLSLAALIIGFVIAVLWPDAPPVLAAADGEKTYKKCQACHSLDAGRHRMGPSLFGIFGAKAGAVDGYAYSLAMENSGIVWDAESLDAFLANPRKMLSGTRMFFPGLRREEDRKAVIAYLKQQGDANEQSREIAVAAPPGSFNDPDNPDLYTSDVNFTLTTA
ncbi:MAG: cytochrome c family protein, partial [Proteobacteria bacterium]|nr:cytochrome c family protein [Pseudomonadota bacterium]